MGTWDYRVVRHSDGTLAIHEVHYERGKPKAMRGSPAASGAGEDEGAAVIRTALEGALRAIGRPVLKCVDFQP